MANEFSGSGYLGTKPELKVVGDEQRKVADMRVYFDKPVLNTDTGEFTDQGGFWLDVSAWDHLAEDVVRLLTKGMRIKVAGSLKHNSWTDEQSGEERSKFTLYATDVTAYLGKIARIELKQPTHEEHPNES